MPQGGAEVPVLRELAERGRCREAEITELVGATYICDKLAYSR